MGPRFCKRGNGGRGFVVIPIRMSLQWGHAFVSVETQFKARAFQRIARLQWGHAFVSVETVGGWELVGEGGGASMGPRFCKRGNTGTQRIGAGNNAPLQWGHAFVSVETRPARARRGAGDGASMGPRFCKRGNPTWSRNTPTPPSLLQWGHAFVSVETRRKMGQRTQRAIRFNGATLL